MLRPNSTLHFVMAAELATNLVYRAVRLGAPVGSIATRVYQWALGYTKDETVRGLQHGVGNNDDKR
eukprot:5072322-Amphidinium_carterae.1